MGLKSIMDDADLNRDRLALALEAAGLDLWENDLITGEIRVAVARDADQRVAGAQQLLRHGQTHAARCARQNDEVLRQYSMVPARVSGQVCSTGAQEDIPVTGRRQGFQ